MCTVWVVTHDFHLGEAIRDLLPHAQVMRFNRTYLFKDALKRGEKPDLVITTNTCKDRNDFDQGKSYPIHYIEAREWATREKIPWTTVPIIFGWYSLRLLKLKLWLRSFLKNQTATAARP